LIQKPKRLNSLSHQLGDMGVYDHPLYYEIAFSFINPREQVDSFERMIKAFSMRKVKRFLDLCCGPSLQLREIARRGYQAVGLDISPQMLRYLEKKARDEQVTIETIRADMAKFRLKRKADFAFIMMGSFTFESNESLLSHLDSVASSLNKGSLYFIQNMLLDCESFEKQSWTMQRDDITVKTDFWLEMKSIVKQVYTERLILEVDDNGKREKIAEERDLKLIYPQEFKTLIDLNQKFEFLGWWAEKHSTRDLDKPLEEAEDIHDNMILLRRK